MKGLWPFAFYVLMFAGVAFLAPFLVLYYQSLGFSGAEIGLLTGITPLITLVCAPLWTNLADATRRHRLLMSLAILGGTLAVVMFPLFETFAPILVMAILYNACFSPISAFADSATLHMLADKKELYGRMRLGGTLGFGAVVTFAGALVQNYSLRFAFWGGAVFMLLALLISQRLIHSPARASEAARGSLRALFTNRRWGLFLTAAFAGGLAMACQINYLFPYLQELGMTESMMGFSVTIGTLSEVPAFFFGHRLVQRFTAYRLFMLAVVLAGLRLVLLANSSSPAAITLLQLLNGLAFPAMWLAGVAYADESAPTGLSATAQGMFSAIIFGFGMAVGGFVGGPLLESLGGRGLYLIFGVAVLAIVGVVVLINKALPAEPVAAGTLEQVG
jgi:PPP family 3-phenylpropionic acid transporter